MSSGYRFRHRTRWQIAMRYSGFPTATRAVAWALSTWWKSDADGSDEPPSIEDLAEASGLSRATVARAMSVLREHGWLEQERGGGRGRRSIYRAVIPPGAEERMEAVLNRRRGGSGSARNRLMGETVWPQKPSHGRDSLAPETVSNSGANRLIDGGGQAQNRLIAPHEIPPAFSAYKAGIGGVSGSDLTGTMTPAPAGSPAPRAPTPWTRHGMTQAQFMQLSREKRWELMTPDEREGAERLRAEKEADTA